MLRNVLQKAATDDVLDRPEIALIRGTGVPHRVADTAALSVDRSEQTSRKRAVLLRLTIFEL